MLITGVEHICLAGHRDIAGHLQAKRGLAGTGRTAEKQQFALPQPIAGPVVKGIEAGPNWPSNLNGQLRVRIGAA